MVKGLVTQPLGNIPVSSIFSFSLAGSTIFQDLLLGLISLVRGTTFSTLNSSTLWWSA